MNKIAYPETAEDMRLLILAITTNVATDLYNLGDIAGANAVVCIILTLEEMQEKIFNGKSL